QNTAAGNYSLYNNSSGSSNTSIGYTSLYENTTGGNNTALGFSSLQNNTSGAFNTGTGQGALLFNISGTLNTACGAQALYYTTANSGNTALGAGAGGSFDNANNNTFLGYGARASVANLSNSTAIGATVQVTASDQVRVGDIFVNSIGGTVGWSTLSDGRFKKNVTENIPGLSFIMKLRPVTYNLDISSMNDMYKTSAGKWPEDLKDKSRTDNSKSKNLYSGFIAQEVEQAAGSLGYQFSGVDAPKNAADYYGLRYGEFVVPVVKAIQEQQVIIFSLEKKIEALEIQNQKLKADNESFRKDLEEIKKVLGK
ncbi:MAG: tail fiber domain-containing protein, partial [Ferruginibacter sp.]